MSGDKVPLDLFPLLNRKHSHTHSELKFLSFTELSHLNFLSHYLASFKLDINYIELTNTVLVCLSTVTFSDM